MTWKKASTVQVLFNISTIVRIVFGHTQNEKKKIVFWFTLSWYRFGVVVVYVKLGVVALVV